MTKPTRKSRITTTIDANLLQSLRNLADQEGKYLNQLFEEGIRHILDTYETKSFLPTKSLVPKIERRKYPRAEVSWPVSLITCRGLIAGEIKDISKGGALIQCNELPKSYDSLELRIEIPDHLLHISATVEKVRLNINENDVAFSSYDLAVRFSGINVDERRNLDNAIEHQVRKISR
jgi:hypothetical protein